MPRGGARVDALGGRAPLRLLEGAGPLLRLHSRAARSQELAPFVRNLFDPGRARQPAARLAAAAAGPPSALAPAQPQRSAARPPRAEPHAAPDAASDATCHAASDAASDAAAAAAPSFAPGIAPSVAADATAAAARKRTIIGPRILSRASRASRRRRRRGLAFAPHQPRAVGHRATLAPRRRALTRVTRGRVGRAGAAAAARADLHAS